MTPVFQRIICENRGDCMTCCIATLLDLPYEQVPTWLADAYDHTKANDLHLEGVPGCPAGTPWHLHHFQPYMMAWLRTQGYMLVQVPNTALTDFKALVGALCIVSMPSQSLPGHWHAAVGQWVEVAEDHHRLEIVHDPNPNNKPYPLEIEPEGITFLVPHDPGKMRMRTNQ
jgi:hypothetical protein